MHTKFVVLRYIDVYINVLTHHMCSFCRYDRIWMEKRKWKATENGRLQIVWEVPENIINPRRACAGGLR